MQALQPWRRRRFNQLLISAAAAGPLMTWGSKAHALAPGDAAPALSLPGLAAPVDLSGLKGRVVYLDFWASWCGPCRQSFPWMNDLQARLGARGLTVVGVNLDARRADADAFLAQHPAQFAIAFDPKGESAQRFGVKGMPSSLLIGSDGRVRLQHSGFRADDAAQLEALITAELPG